MSHDEHHGNEKPCRCMVNLNIVLLNIEQKNALIRFSKPQTNNKKTLPSKVQLSAFTLSL